MRDFLRFRGALATVTLLAAGTLAAILAACGGYGGGSNYGGGGGGGGGGTCGGGYGTMCPKPTITLTAPAAGSYSGTVPMSATANASSTYGLTVTQVQFLVDGMAVGTGTLGSMSSYTFMWSTTKANDGAHTVTATVTDSAGGMTTSGAVSITITTAAAAMVSMTPAQIFPMPMSHGSGRVHMTVRSESGALSGRVNLVGVSATAVTLNEGFAGATGPAVVRLAPGGSAGEWQIPAGALLTAEQLTALSQGKLYVIAASAAYPRGEIRGQIVPPHVAVTFAPLSAVPGAQSVSRGAGGVIATTVDRSALTLSVHVSSTGADDADAARVASAGRMLAELSKDAVDFGHWSTELAPIAAGEVQRFEAGQWNVRIATPVELSGALHGDISAPAH